MATPKNKEIPQVFNQELEAFPKLRKFWSKIYSSKIYQRVRHSALNPYRWGLKKNRG